MVGETTHPAPLDPQKKTPRTAASRQRRDRYSAPVRWAAVTGRSRDGRFIREVRADLLRHVGGNPTTPQRVLIERAVMLTLNLAKMDAKALKTGAMSEHATREYLAWSNTLTRTLAALGLEAAPAPARDLRAILADRAAGR